MAFALGRAALAEGEKRRQPAIGGAVLGEGEEAHPVAQIEPHTDDEADAGLLRRLMRAHEPGDAVAVGDRDRRETERRGLLHQLVRMRAAAQKGEIAGHLKLGIAACGDRGETIAGLRPPLAEQGQALAAADRARQPV
jgi:hypothetical protein